MAQGVMSGGAGTIRFALACAALLAALTLVVWRQSRALEVLRSLDELRTERAVVEAERSAVARRIQELDGRARLVTVAGEWFGMRVPSGNEIVILATERAP
jgi:predicted RNA methylase